MFTKLRKERDYHRMHHRRVVQEKNRLITDLKRMKDHYACFEPTLRQLKCKYELAMKEKMLTKLEKDRAVSQVQGLKSTLKTIEDSRSSGTILPGMDYVSYIGQWLNYLKFIFLILPTGPLYTKARGKVILIIFDFSMFYS